jgi:undecaprenyl-diphosphatase
LVERLSPVDVLRMVVAGSGLVVLLLVEWWFGDSVVSFASDLLRGLDAIDRDVATVAVVVVRVLALGLLVVGFGLVLVRGQWRFLASVSAGAGLAVVLHLLVDGAFDVEAPPLVETEDWLGMLSGRGFPTAAGLAAVTGVVAAGVPWCPRRQRRIGWALVLAVAGVRLLTAPLSGETLAALFCGALGGALANALLGAPSRRPTEEAVVEGLGGVGVRLRELRPAAVDARGSTPYFGTTADGRPLFVKALGADERKADLLFRLVRSVHARDLGDERPFSSLRRAVEHEALVALAASEVGVRTPAVAAFAAAEPGGFVLAYEAVAGRSLDGVEPEELTDGVLSGLWDQMRILREHGIAHRDLRLANVFLADDGRIWLIDFGFSELAASPVLLATDLAELVTALSLTVGPERAVQSAVTAVGAEPLRAARDRFSPGYLSGATRTALKERPGLLEDLQRRVDAAQTTS